MSMTEYHPLKGVIPFDLSWISSYEVTTSPMEPTEVTLTISGHGGQEFLHAVRDHDAQAAPTDTDEGAIKELKDQVQKLLRKQEALKETILDYSGEVEALSAESAEKTEELKRTTAQIVALNGTLGGLSEQGRSYKDLINVILYLPEDTINQMVRRLPARVAEDIASARASTAPRRITRTDPTVYNWSNHTTTNEPWHHEYGDIKWIE